MLILSLCIFALTSGGLADPLVEKVLKLEKQVNALQNTVSGMDSKTKAQLSKLESELHLQKLTIQNVFSMLLSLQTKVTSTAGNKGNSGAGIHVEQFPIRPMNSELDNGILKTVWYTKKSASSSLRVTWVGNVHVHAHKDKKNGCNRWYFSFGSAECRNPQKIDSIYYAGKAAPEHIPMTVDGVCQGLPSGNTEIRLNVGPCDKSPGVELGDAYTGYNEPTSIIVEEF